MARLVLMSLRPSITCRPNHDPRSSSLSARQSHARSPVDRAIFEPHDDHCVENPNLMQTTPPICRYLSSVVDRAETNTPVSGLPILQGLHQAHRALLAYPGVPSIVLAQSFPHVNFREADTHVHGNRRGDTCC